MVNSIATLFDRLCLQMKFQHMSVYVKSNIHRQIKLVLIILKGSYQFFQCNKLLTEKGFSLKNIPVGFVLLFSTFFSAPNPFQIRNSITPDTTKLLTISSLDLVLLARRISFAHSESSSFCFEISVFMSKTGFNEAQYSSRTHAVVTYMCMNLLIYTFEIYPIGAYFKN